MSITVLIHGGSRPSRESAAQAAPSLTFDAPRIVLGRGEGCEVRLPDPSVSHRHATIRQRGAEYMLVDEGSTNGTRMGRVLLSAHSPRAIRSGELVRVGRVWLELRVEPAPPTTSPGAAAKEIALDLVSASLAREGEDGRPRVLVEAGPDAGRELRIEAGTRHVVGRSKEAHLALEDTALSRRHVEIARRGDVLVARDLGSKAGAAIEDRALGAVDAVWKIGEKLELGSSVLVYEFEAAAVLAEIERSPDEKVANAELEIGDEPTIEAPQDPVADAAPEEELPEPSFAPPPAAIERPGDTKRRAGSSWGLTDFAVVLLALGVVSLSAVGYFALLR